MRENRSGFVHKDALGFCAAAVKAKDIAHEESIKENGRILRCSWGVYTLRMPSGHPDLEAGQGVIREAAVSEKAHWPELTLFSVESLILT